MTLLQKFLKSGRYNVEISQTEISENLKITYDGFVYLDMVKTCLNDSSNVSSATYEFFNSFLFDKKYRKNLLDKSLMLEY